MTTSIAPGRTGRRTWNKRYTVPAIGAAMLALAAAGIGTWQVVDRGDNAPAAGVAAPRPAVGQAAGPARPQAPARASGRTTIYLVATQEQADRVRTIVNEAGAISAEVAAAVGRPEVALIESAEHEERILRGIAEADAIRAGSYLPPIEVIDLRSK